MAAGAHGLELRWREGLPSQWDEWVCGVPDASFSARAGFLEALGHFPGDGHLAVLEAVDRQGRRVGAVPVYFSQRWGRTWARSLPFGTYGGPLLAPGATDPASLLESLGGAFAEACRARRVVGGEWVLGPSLAPTPPPALGAWAGGVTEGTTHLLDLTPGSAALYAALKRETKKGFRKAERDGVEVVVDASGLPAVHALYLEQARRWGTRRPYPLPFLAQMLAHPSCFAQLFVARREGVPLAGVLALSSAEETFLWWSGSSSASRETLAYPYLLWCVLEVAARDGRRRLNIGSSGGRDSIVRFKESLGAAAHPIWILHLRPSDSDLLGRAVQWLRRRRRRA